MDKLEVVYGSCENCKFYFDCNGYKTVDCGDYYFDCDLKVQRIYRDKQEVKMKGNCNICKTKDCKLKGNNRPIDCDDFKSKVLTEPIETTELEDKLTGHYGTGGLDPYEVYHKTNMKENEIGGVIFHIFKTCMRFGKKNEKERELKSIIASAKRGLELLDGDKNE